MTVYSVYPTGAIYTDVCQQGQSLTDWLKHFLGSFTPEAVSSY